MKNAMLTVMLLLAVVALTACGSKPGGAQEDRSGAAAAQTETPAEEAALLSGDEVAALAAAQTERTSVEAPQAPQTEDDRSIDLDLTTISGTVVYSQVYDMTVQPEAYLGKRIRMKGAFSYFQDPDTRREYFAAVIADATACCAQGIEFVWKGEHAFPRDYPPVDTEITVTGIFGTYEEDGYTYLQLADADVSW